MASRAPVWFAFDNIPSPRLLRRVCGRTGTSVRKVKEGETTNDLRGFLIINPNAESRRHSPEGHARHFDGRRRRWIIWMTAPVAEALKLQRPLPDGALRIVAQGGKTNKSATVA